MIKAAAQEQLPVMHPGQAAFEGITIAMLTAPPAQPEAHAKNAVIVSTGKLGLESPRHVDRPALIARLAAPALPREWRRHAKGKLRLGEDFNHEGILGTIFTGRLVEETQVGPIVR